MIECPYCETEIEDPCCDNREPDTVYQEECEHCGKNFIYTLDYTIDYYPEKADCLNDKPHDLQRRHVYPAIYAIGERVCSMCDEKFDVCPEPDEIEILKNWDQAHDLDYCKKRLEVLYKKYPELNAKDPSNDK